MNPPRTAREVVDSMGQLATMPELHLKLLTVINSPMSSAMDMARVISRDPSLTARLLKQSNSAYYGQGSSVATVSKAITVVGVHQLREISLSTSVVRMFNRLPQDLIVMDEFWKHSVLTGLLARELATMAEIPDVEHAFVGGLLHDIGRVLMMASMPVEFRKALLFARASKHSLNKVEHDQIGFTHAQVGAELFRSWGLPPSLIDALEFHHFPELASRNKDHVAVIHVADALAHCIEVGNSGESRVPPLQSGTWDLLKLNAEDLPTLLKEAEANVLDVQRSLMQTEEPAAESS